MKRLIIQLCQSYSLRKKKLLEQGILGYIKNEKGYVLIIVMIVSTLLITVSSEFLVNAQADVSYMNKFKSEPQAEELAEIGLRIATYILELDKTGKAGALVPGRNTNASVDSYDDLWGARFPEIPLEGGSVSFVINDEQSKINLSIVANEFIDKSAYFYMTARFFQNLDFPPDIADCILDWVDPNNNRSGYGAETFDYYSTLPRPYHAKNGPLDSIEELLMIKNITPEIYYGLGGGNYGKEIGLVNDNRNLKPISLDDMNAIPDQTKIPTDAAPIGPEKSRALYDYFRAYGDPDFTVDLNKININTAPYRVISALTPDMTADKVSELIRRRMAKPFAAVSEVADLVPDEAIRKCLTVSSQIFSIDSTGRFKGKKIVIRTVYNRTTKKFLYYAIR
jgi:type II secretory pathway component PulK